MEVCFLFMCSSSFSKMVRLFRLVTFKSSHRMCSVRKGFLRNFTKFTGKHLCQSLFFNKVTGLRLATLLKKKLWLRCFLVIFAKFLRTTFLQKTSGRKLLNYDKYRTSVLFNSIKISNQVVRMAKDPHKWCHHWFIDIVIMIFTWSGYNFQIKLENVGHVW